MYCDIILILLTPSWRFRFDLEQRWSGEVREETAEKLWGFDMWNKGENRDDDEDKACADEID